MMQVKVEELMQIIAAKEVTIFKLNQDLAQLTAELQKLRAAQEEAKDGPGGDS